MDHIAVSEGPMHGLTHNDQMQTWTDMCSALPQRPRHNPIRASKAHKQYAHTCENIRIISAGPHALWRSVRKYGVIDKKVWE